MTTWMPLGDPPPATLVATRLQLHWASHALASFGESFVPHRDDYRHRAMMWSPGLHGMVNWGRSRSGHGLCLDPAAFRLALFDGDGVPTAALDISGQTLAQVFDWLRDSLPAAGLQADALQILPTGRLPAADPGAGAPFHGGDPAARAELGRWFANAAEALSDVCDRNPGASPVLAWPHHFDMATLITTSEHDDPEKASSVGVGFAPGDDAYAEPYFYVTPWPYPAISDLPPLPGEGGWHTEGWVGAVLSGTELVGVGGGVDQERAARGFLSAAVEAGRTLLA
jgi:hypothetical protein